jgi:uncharacterized membrane protein YjjP (DUF1212 family)
MDHLPLVNMKQNPEPQEPTIEQIADLLTDIASSLMSSGSHTKRIIRNVSRIAAVLGYDTDITLLQMSVMLTITNADDRMKRLTINKKLNPLLLNFTTVSDLSSLSWRTHDDKLPFDVILSEYKRIVSQKRISPWLVMFLVGCANAAFCGLFKGDLPSAGLVFIATIIGFFLRQEMNKRHVNHLISFTASAFVASLVAGMAYVFRIGATPQIALAASVLYLIPGVPLINSVLDLIEGHILIGISRFVNAASLIVCIAIGLFASMLILGLEKL